MRGAAPAHAQPVLLLDQPLGDAVALDHAAVLVDDRGADVEPVDGARIQRAFGIEHVERRVQLDCPLQVRQQRRDLRALGRVEIAAAVRAAHEERAFDATFATQVRAEDVAQVERLQVLPVEIVRAPRGFAEQPVGREDLAGRLVEKRAQRVELLAV